MKRVLTALAILTTIACAKPAEEPAVGPTTEKPTAVAKALAPDVRGEVIKYEVDGVTFTGYLAYDDQLEGPRPGVLVVHEWWGHNEYARKRAEMLADMGYTALALDMYGEGKLAEHPEDAEKFMMEILGSLETGVARFEAARKLLEDHPTTDPDKTAAIGYCFGGGVVLHMARIGAGLDAVASFHGGLAPLAPAQPGITETRILVAHGADDPMVPAEQIDAFQQEMADAGADMKFISYPGAQHSFTNPGATSVGEEFGMPLAYNEDADIESWGELEVFLGETFAGE
ncbi:MAG: dienelactone hydrolase family protein [bacterium]|nr:dienelactone hydrolase family protein [bacterium]